MSKNPTKTAYPVAPTGHHLQQPRDVSKWARAAQEINFYADQGYPVAKCFDHVTQDWGDPEKVEFQQWLKFYQEGAHEKYKMASEKDYLQLDGMPAIPMHHLKAKLPGKRDHFPYMERILERQEADDQARRAEEEAERERQENLKKKVKSLDSRLRSALKLMADPEIQRELGPKMDISIHDWVRQLQDLQRYVMLVPSQIRHAQSLDDLVFRKASYLSSEGFHKAANVLVSLAQVEPPPVGELGELGDLGDLDTDLDLAGEEGEEEGSAEAPEEDLPDLEEGGGEAELLPEEGFEDEVDHTAMKEVMKLMNGFKEDISSAEDELEADDFAEHVVVAQVLPPEERIRLKNQPEFVVGEEGDPDMPRAGVTLEKVIERFEGISHMLKNREIPRQFGIADIELNELGMASYFPSLAEALKSALDSNQYMLTRVEDIISKLRGAIPPKMDFDLEEEPERRQDPALEAVRNTLEQQEQIEKDKAERRRQERLAPPEPEVAPTPVPELERPVEVQRAEPTRVTPEG
jgi:hypothetical protein